jgi:hypothetical protein
MIENPDVKIFETKGFLKELFPEYLPDHQVSYFLKINQEVIGLSPAIGRQVSIQFTGNIKCSGCEKPIKKIFHSGVCFVCSQNLI